MSAYPKVYVEALRVYAHGGTLPGDLLDAALSAAGANGARFGRDLDNYRASPQTFHPGEPVFPARPAKLELRIRFQHGLGDCCQAAALLRLWRRRGWEIEVAGSPDKAWLWRALGYGPYAGRDDAVPNAGWFYSGRFGNLAEPEHLANKTAHNIAAEPFPPIGTSADLWPELCAERIDLRQKIKRPAHEAALGFLAGLPKPVVALHGVGANWRARKSLPNPLILSFQTLWHYRTGGSVVVLDWAGLTPVADSPAVRAINPLWGRISIEELAALYCHVEALVGIDSGPFHFANLVPVPAVGVFFPTLPCVHVCVPNPNATYLCPATQRDAWLAAPPHWRISEYAGLAPSPERLADEVERRVEASAEAARKARPTPEIPPAPPPAPGLAHEPHGPPFERRCRMWTRRGKLGDQDGNVIAEVAVHDGYRLSLRTPKRAGLVVFDIGAHIGAFARTWNEKHPGDTIVCVEACPENIPVLAANVAGFASVFHAACTYEPGRLALLNSVKENGTATGGSIVVQADEIERPGPSFQAEPNLYWRDLRRLPTVTLEDLMRAVGADRIDVLKLDCEGSEMSILANTPSLDKIGFVFGEYHGQERWDALVAARFAGWPYAVMHAAGGLGIFHLENPAGSDI